jgi:hypothetical protein
MKMHLTFSRAMVGCLAVGCLAVGMSTAWSQAVPTEEQTGRTDRELLPQPVYKVANKNLEEKGVMVAPVAAEHPLAPAIRLAKASLDHINVDIKDYTATMVKRERINGTLGEKESMLVKIRQQPFSVYMRFIFPKRLDGQEVIYVAGKNDGKMLARGVGFKKMLGMVSLDPNGALAMQGQRYPITEIGFANLTKRLIEVAEHDAKYDECKVEFHDKATLNQRPCIGIIVTHPTPRPQFKFNVATIMLDTELNVPVYYSAREWPTKLGGAPELLEEYSYTNIKINQGLTDLDFDDKNPAYNFH